MQKTNQPKSKIIEKVPLKNKLLVKSVITESSEIMALKFGYEDTMAACAYSDGLIRVFNLSTDNKICQFDTNSKPNQNIPSNCLRWRPQAQNNTMSAVILAASTNGNFYQFAAKTGKKIYHGVEQDNFIMAMDYAPDGSCFATAGKDNIVRIYDQQTKKITQDLRGITWHKAGHNNRLFSVKFKVDEPDILISGGWDQNINVWDRRLNQSVATLYGPKITGDSLDIKDNFIISGANRGHQQLQLWDWRQKKVVHSFRWDEQNHETGAFLFSCQFCKNSPNTVMACGASEMKIFSLQDFNQMLQIKFQEKESLYSCDSSYGSNRYLVGGKSGSMFYFGSNKTFD